MLWQKTDHMHNKNNVRFALCDNTHLEISVVHTPTMAIVNCIYKLLEVFPWLLLFEPSLVNLAMAKQKANYLGFCSLFVLNELNLCQRKKDK
jgi:hypothetical protein